MKESLEKIINRLLLPKYPWIKDFEIKVYTFSPVVSNSKKIGFESYAVIYDVVPGEENIITRNEFMKVEELTETLFKMVGPEHYQNFKGVEFYVEE